jgi:hypothetical protein
MTCQSSSTHEYSSHGRREVFPARSINQSTMPVSQSGNSLKSGMRNKSAVPSRPSISASSGAIPAGFQIFGLLPLPGVLATILAAIDARITLLDEFLFAVGA